MSARRPILIAAFDRGDLLPHAVVRLRAAGYGELEACTPMPVPGLPEALSLRSAPIGVAGILGGLVGGGGMLFMEWYSSVVAYPLNIGGRPHASWPAFGPPALEMTLLFAGLFAFVAFLFGSRLPHMHHPAFDADLMERASEDRYCLLLPVADPDRMHQARALLLESGAVALTEIGP